MTLEEFELMLDRLRRERDAIRARWAAEGAALDQEAARQTAWFSDRLEQRRIELDRRTAEKALRGVTAVPARVAARARWEEEDASWAAVRVMQEQHEQLLRGWLAGRDDERKATFARWKAEEARIRNGLSVESRKSVVN